MKFIKWIGKKLTLFDFLVISVILVLGLSFFFFFYREAEYVDIRVKVTDQDILYAGTRPSIWYANRFQVGDVERDALGRVITEIVGVERFNVTEDEKAVYLDLKIRALYDSRTEVYSARGKPLVFGTPLRFDFSKVVFDGLVTDSPTINVRKNTKIEYLKVSALLRGFRPEEVPVEPLLFEAVKRGDKLLDSQGNLLAEVLDIKTRPAEHVTQNSRGDLLLRKDPLYKDGLFVLRIRTEIVDGERFMFDNIPVRIGEWIPLNFEHVSMYPVITDFLPDE